jgi:hypothetical protein
MAQEALGIILSNRFGLGWWRSVIFASPVGDQPGAADNFRPIFFPSFLAKIQAVIAMLLLKKKGVTRFKIYKRTSCNGANTTSRLEGPVKHDSATQNDDRGNLGTFDVEHQFAFGKSRSIRTTLAPRWAAEPDGGTFEVATATNYR